MCTAASGMIYHLPNIYDDITAIAAHAVAVAASLSAAGKVFVTTPPFCPFSLAANFLYTIDYHDSVADVKWVCYSVKQNMNQDLPW